MKILIFITTYNRPKMLLDLLKDIKKQQGKYDLHVYVHDDCSPANYQPVRLYLSRNFERARYISNLRNRGKAGFWETINEAYQYIKTQTWDFVIELPDDIRLTDNFFDESIRLFSQGSAPCMNLLTEYSRQLIKMWTDIEPRSLNNEVNITGWVDMCFIADRVFFEVLDYSINEVPKSWAANPTKSSGVGMQISQRIVKAGYHFAQVKESLVIHGDHHSQMHPTERKVNKLITNHKRKNTRRIAGMATMPDREESLKKVVNSILFQVDELHIYLNEWDYVPDFLFQHGITVYRSQDEIGDLGDVGKFYAVKNAKGYFFSIDDDLIYPTDYINTLEKAIEKHGRQKAISFHGRTFGNMPVSSYYHGHVNSASCLSDFPVDISAHVVGTGVLGFHTDTLKIGISDFSTLNMADIWFSMLCEDQNVERLILKHPANWIEYTKIPIEKTIAGKEYHKDSLQTYLVNSINWKKVKNMPTEGLLPEVARKYYVKTIKPGKYNFKGFGEIDLRTITLQKADRLVEHGFQFLVLKPGYKTPNPEHGIQNTEPRTPNTEQKTQAPNKELQNKPPDISAFRKNRDYINKLLTMSWDNLNFQERLIFNDEQVYFLEKQKALLNIKQLNDAMKSAHAAMRKLHEHTKNDSERAQLLEKLSDMDAVKASLWKEIDTWKEPQSANPEAMKIKAVQKEALEMDKTIKAHSNYIWRGEKELQKKDIKPERKAYLTQEIKRRKEELIEMGQPYSRKSRK